MDKYNLRRLILEYPNQLNLGQKFAENIKLPPKEYSNLIICGMGGSALPGDLLVNYFQNQQKFDLSVYISRSYHLPKNANKKSLIFISSYSGNTEETISCFKEALGLGASVVVFTKGGRIAEIAKEKKVPMVRYDLNFENFQPRYAATYAFVAMHQVLTNLKLTDIITEFPKVDISSLEKEGQTLAKKLKNKTPVVYASNQLKVVAKNWKIKINENAKTPAFWNYFPELNHNEMVGFTNPQGKFFNIILSTENEKALIEKRMKITNKLYQQKGVNGEIIQIKGSGHLEKLLNGIVLGDWTSYYLALEYGQDPTPVDMVEDFKEKMK